MNQDAVDFVIIAGNVVDGVTVVGPFEESEQAVHYGDDQLKDEEWVVTRLDRPVDQGGVP